VAVLRKRRESLQPKRELTWWRVTTCSRVNDHAVICGIALTIPRNGILLACGDVVRIWIRGTSYRRYWNEVSAQCD
jgi:hypothetical protein